MRFHLFCTAARLGLLAVPLALAAAGTSPARAQAPAADAGSTAEQTIAVMHTLWGQHAGMRANHAKGLVVEGSFTPSAAGAKLSKAPLFAGPAVPVTARFSDATGVPDIGDNNPNALPNGLAVKFHLPGDAEMDMVLNTLAFFPVATGEEFRDLLVAASKSGPDAPKPTPIDVFLQAHPQAPKAFGSVPAPTSLARVAYNGVDAFVFVDAAGKRQPFRFRAVPAEGVETLTADAATKQAPDFLFAELPKRLAAGPVTFHLTAQLAQAGDSTSDPTIPWPADRPVVDLGTLSFSKVTADNAAVAKSILFLPNNLPDGIEVSDDPLIDARVQSYAVSFGLRAQ